MLRNHFLVALRTLRRRKGYAALNVVGLALSLALGTVAALAWRAARLDPVDALRYE